MSTTLDQISTNDFAQQCINSLADVKRSLPKTWKSALQPYKDEISALAAANKTNTTRALLTIITNINDDVNGQHVLKVKHVYYLAAYCDML